MQEVEAICDRVIIIDHGKIVTDKKLKNLVKEDKLEQIIEVEFDKPTTAEALQTLTNLVHAKNVPATTGNLRSMPKKTCALPCLTLHTATA